MDIVAALIGLALVWWLIAVAILLARRDTRASGLFRQQRIGKNGRLFRICKIRSMRIDHSLTITATAANDPRITRLGRWLRATKIDELPQLWNVLVGDMSFVGPRPETPEHLDLFRNVHPEVLSIRPGVTCPATLLFRCEETLLAGVADPAGLSRRVLLPVKLGLNAQYAAAHSLAGDLKCLLHTVAGTGPRLRNLSDLTTAISPEYQRHVA